MKYILGIDIGTSNTKAIAYTLNGQVIAHTHVGYSFASDHEGYHELDPQALFNAVVEVISGAVKAAAGHELQGLSFSAAMHGIFAVDDRGAPLMKMLTWADLRSKDYAERLKNSPQGSQIYQRTGTPIHPMSPLCKLMWMKDQLPGVFHSAHKFISIKEYIFFQLFDDYIVDHSIASATGLFDIHDLRWNDDALRLAGISAEKLSTPVAATKIYTGLKNGFDAKLGVDARIPFVVGGSDGCLAHLGSNALRPGDVSLTIGTSGAVRMMSRKPMPDSQERIFNYLLTDDLYVAGGPLNNGGNVLQWFNTNMAGRTGNSTDDYNWFVSQAAKIAPGSGGLIFLPYIYGERAPVWDANTRGLFFGVSGSHTQAHFARSILEGISFALLEVLQILEEVIAPAKSICVSGGFTQSADWVTLLSEVLGKTLLVPDVEDASSAGAAIIGMLATGMIPSLDNASAFFRIRGTFAPQPQRSIAYQDNYHIYTQLYKTIKDLKK